MESTVGDGSVTMVNCDKLDHVISAHRPKPKPAGLPGKWGMLQKRIGDGWLKDGSTPIKARSSSFLDGSTSAAASRASVLWMVRPPPNRQSVLLGP